jgi:hypothetical protein
MDSDPSSRMMCDIVNQSEKEAIQLKNCPLGES